MKLRVLLVSVSLAAVVAAAAAPAVARAQTIEIKVGTLAPEGTPWYDVIQEMGAKWRAASGGKIKLTIFPGGVQGDEAAMILKMRTGQLHMGAFTTNGLETITKDMSALWIPLLFRDYDELDYVRDRLAPRFEKTLGEAGFVVLNWGDAGWVKYFATTPIPTLEALQTKKLFTWAGSSQSEEMYKDAGFQVVPLPATDILQALQTGMIDAFPAPATAALANQWFGLAKNMMDIRFAPVVGGTIITRAAWEKFEPSLRKTLLDIAKETGRKYVPRIRSLEDDAIAAMVKRGLQTQKLTPQAEQEWRQMAERFYPKIRGTIIPADLFDEVTKLVTEYRAQSAAAAQK